MNKSQSTTSRKLPKVEMQVLILIFMFANLIIMIFVEIPKGNEVSIMSAQNILIQIVGFIFGYNNGVKSGTVKRAKTVRKRKVANSGI